MVEWNKRFVKGMSSEPRMGRPKKENKERELLKVKNAMDVDHRQSVWDVADQ